MGETTTAARRRLVVKIGSATLTTSESSIDYGFLDDLAAQLDTVRRAGWDVVVVNSCTVTAEGDRKTRQLLRRLRREHPGAAICLTGCFPQAFPGPA